MAEITKKQILDKEDNPQALEDLYRSDPVKFKASLVSAAAHKPASKLFEFWRVRIEYEDPAPPFSAVPIAVVMQRLALDCWSGFPKHFLLKLGTTQDSDPFLLYCQLLLIFFIKTLTTNYLLG